LEKPTLGIKLADGTYFPIMEDGIKARKRLVLSAASSGSSQIKVEIFRGYGESLQNASAVGMIVLDPSEQEQDIELFLEGHSSGDVSATANHLGAKDSQSFSVKLDPLPPFEDYEAPEEEDLDDFSQEGRSDQEILNDDSFLDSDIDSFDDLDDFSIDDQEDDLSTEEMDSPSQPLDFGSEEQSKGGEDFENDFQLDELDQDDFDIPQDLGDFDPNAPIDQQDIAEAVSENEIEKDLDQSFEESSEEESSFESGDEDSFSLDDGQEGDLQVDDLGDFSLDEDFDLSEEEDSQEDALGSMDLDDQMEIPMEEGSLDDSLSLEENSLEEEDLSFEDGEELDSPSEVSSLSMGSEDDLSLTDMDEEGDLDFSMDNLDSEGDLDLGSSDFSLDDDLSLDDQSLETFPESDDLPDYELDEPAPVPEPMELEGLPPSSQSVKFKEPKAPQGVKEMENHVPRKEKVLVTVMITSLFLMMFILISLLLFHFIKTPAVKPEVTLAPVGRYETINEKGPYDLSQPVALTQSFGPDLITLDSHTYGELYLHPGTRTDDYSRLSFGHFLARP